MKAEVVKCPLNTDLQDKLNRMLKTLDYPTIEYVTHTIHANTHWLTIWYLGGGNN